jgi:SAM-dependent methyltransferase
MFCIERYYPHWKSFHIYEPSPASRGASLKLKKHCKHYSASHYFTDFPSGEIHPSGFRNENIEKLTFRDNSFDLVITQDIMEHVFNPAAAFMEIKRVLKPEGAHIFSVPLVNKEKQSEVWAKKDGKGDIIYIESPEYHGNPISEKGSLVTMHWGYDICDFIYQHSSLVTTIHYIDDLSLGIRAEFIEILISKRGKDQR